MNLTSIPELSTLLAVALAVSGAIYALRRQEQTFAVVDNADLLRRVKQLEQANQYLLGEIDTMRRENRLLSGVISDMQDEAKALKQKTAEQFEEISALRKVLEK